jgi:hypothetical protein
MPSIAPAGSHKVSSRNCVRALGVHRQRAETQFYSARLRAEAATADAPNAAWLARTKLHWFARSVR